MNMKNIVRSASTLALLIAFCAHQAMGIEKVIVPEHVRISLDSKILNEGRVINVYVPDEVTRTPSLKVPALYMPDGGTEEDFIHVARTIDDGIRSGEVAPLILVGIQNTERRRDMTGPTAVATDREIAPRAGGSAAFRRFIRDELMPEIEAGFPVNAQKGIIGESLAGLFIMETLAEAPTMFDTYIALSPSLWWNDATLVTQLKASRKLPAHTRVYLASADEDNIVPHVEALRPSPAKAKEGWVIEARPDLSHSTIYRTLGPRAIRMLYPKAKP